MERMSDAPRRDPEGEPDDPRSGWLRDADLLEPPPDRPDGIEDQDRRVRVFSRQVCIRLSAAQYGELSRAAEIYGVAPGTMGRILVRRGARAVMDSYRRYDLPQG